MESANRRSRVTHFWPLGAALSLAACGGSVETQDHATGGAAGSTTTATGSTSAAGGTGGAGGQSTSEGGSLFTTTTLPPNPFPCGDFFCDATKQYCLESGGGPCCSPPTYECRDLPPGCLSPGADCSCFQPGEAPCTPDGGVLAECQSVEGGGLEYLCGYP